MWRFHKKRGIFQCVKLNKRFLIGVCTSFFLVKWMFKVLINSCSDSFFVLIDKIWNSSGKSLNWTSNRSISSSLFFLFISKSFILQFGFKHAENRIASSDFEVSVSGFQSKNYKFINNFFFKAMWYFVHDIENMRNTFRNNHFESIDLDRINFLIPWWAIWYRR